MTLLYTCPYFSSCSSPPSYIYSLSLHDALPIFFLRPIAQPGGQPLFDAAAPGAQGGFGAAVNGRQFAVTQPLHHLARSEEHTSELQSRFDLVCRLLLEKKKIIIVIIRQS